MGGLLNGTQPSAALKAALKANAGSYTWVAATIGSNNASGYQLATGEPVMPIGGFNGNDPSPTLAQFQKYVADGKIHYFLGGGMGGGMGPGGGNGYAQQISSWVQQNFTATTVGGTTVYDLTKPKN
jgi:4-amino-4-deoxy-L-arabinose transferase-like glycosyltransferase